MFDKCELEPNILCDAEHNCLDCIKRENAWAEAWISGPGEAEPEGEEAEKAHITVELEARRD